MEHGRRVSEWVTEAKQRPDRVDECDCSGSGNGGLVVLGVCCAGADGLRNDGVGVRLICAMPRRRRRGTHQEGSGDLRSTSVEHDTGFLVWGWEREHSASHEHGGDGVGERDSAWVGTGVMVADIGCCAGQ